MITVTQNDFIYIPSKKKLEVKKTKHQWEGVPQNLIGDVVNILRYPTRKEKVMALHMLSKNIFHSKLIGDIVGVSCTTVSTIISKNLQAEYQKIKKQKNQ